MARKLKHDKYIEDLLDILRPDYETIYTNVPLYSEKKRNTLVAEIDVIAFKGNSCDVFEVKCSYRIAKAKKQLKKIKRLLPSVTNLFFFCGESGCLESICN